jgi:hypothetical protein
MRQVAMQIKRGADARPEIDREHDRQVMPMKLRAETDDAEHLQADQRNEEIEIELIVLKHEANGPPKACPYEARLTLMFYRTGTVARPYFQP